MGEIAGIVPRDRAIRFFSSYEIASGALMPEGLGQLLMIAVCCVLLYLGIAKKFEPLLLVPIAFGGILANIPFAGLSEPGGLLDVLYHMGIENTLFPLLILWESVQ